MLKRIGIELKIHAPFTAFGAGTGIAIMAFLLYAGVSRSVSGWLFWTLHPLHVFLSALATTGMYRAKSRAGLGSIILVGYGGSIGIATLSDSLIPYLGEWMLDLPNRVVHIGFVEKWWLVNPLAALGIAVGYLRPSTKLPHAGHVLLSTWASLFHMTLAMGEPLSLLGAMLVMIFLFVAVWVPCCTSDIAFPMLFVSD
jgi:hypothetical protein